MSTRRLMEELRGRLRGGAEGAPRPPSTVRPTSASPAPLHPASARPAPRTSASSSASLSRPASSRPAPGRSTSARHSTERAASGQAAIERPSALPVHDPRLLEELKASTPAKVGVGRAGLRYRTQTLLQFLADFAVAKAAVESQVPAGWGAEQGCTELCTAADGPEQFLTRPDLGRRLSDDSLRVVREKFTQQPEVQIVVGDGLSATAVMQNAPAMLATLREELARRGRSVGTPAFVRHCRAKIVDVIGEAVQARVGIILVGERPGLGTGDGMSAYLVWQPAVTRTDAEKQAISNIHARGMRPEEAGTFAARLIDAILEQRTSGVGLDVSGIEAPAGGSSKASRVNPIHPEPHSGCGQSHGQQCERARNGLPGATCGRSEGRPCEACRH